MVESNPDCFGIPTNHNVRCFLEVVATVFPCKILQPITGRRLLTPSVERAPMLKLGWWHSITVSTCLPSRTFSGAKRASSNSPDPKCQLPHSTNANCPGNPISFRERFQSRKHSHCRRVCRRWTRSSASFASPAPRRGPSSTKNTITPRHHVR